MSQNLVEIIAQKHAVDLEVGSIVRSGDFVSIRPAHVLTHDNTGAVIPKFRSIGAAQMANPRQPVFALDHGVQDRSQANLDKYARIEAFATGMGVDFYPAGRGIGHQVMLEEGYAWPGTMVVASDSHSNTYGGLGCLGTPVVRTDAAAIWATGRTWWQVPPVARVRLTGKPPAGVSGKDIIITLTGLFNEDEVLNHALEFCGEGVGALSIEQRLTIANMSTEWGALAAIFPVDDAVIAWAEERSALISSRGLEGVPSDSDGDGGHPRVNQDRIATLKENRPVADRDAVYACEIELDLGTLQPVVAGPHNVKTVTPASAYGGGEVKINKAYLLSCTNGRIEDLADAAAVLRGRKIAPGVELYLAAASSNVQAASEKSGDWQALVDAGARVLPPGCGPCIGLGEGLLEDGERGISATNRNFRGRMGSREAEALLASPAVVAASAIAGHVALPDGLTFNPQQAASARMEEPPSPEKEAAEVTILDGFPTAVEGEILLCREDNLNTDGIYPGKYTYQDDITAEEQARVAMENYDPAFQDLVREGDFLLGGFNFGTGSSREQAATALMHRGVRLLLAGSFSETYKRNALNNGFLILEAPELSRELVSRFGEQGLTVRTALSARLDFRRSVITVGGLDWPVSTLGPAAQELILSGGLEGWVRAQLA